MNARPRVSLLLPNRDNERTLDLVFERLAKHTTYPDVEVVAVDDGSTDDSVAILRRWRDSGRFRAFQLHEREPSGVVATLNHGLQAATGEVVVQLDADATIETPWWVEQMLELLLSDPKVGVVTAKVVIDSGVSHTFGVNVLSPEGFYDRGTRLLEKIGQRTSHQRVERLPWQIAPYGDEAAEVDAGMGCCMMYRRDDALAVGGYDMGFQPVWFDDADLALTIRAKRDKKVFFLPDVFVCHRLGMRSPREDVKRERTASERVTQKIDWWSQKLFSPAVQRRLTRRLDLDKPPPPAAERLAHHYAYWREKWGWDMLNPDMDVARERWGDTEVWWSYDPARRAEGERILRDFRASQSDTARAQRFVERFGFLPPPAWSVMQPYDDILEAIRERGLMRLDGDFLEIGVFLGGGVYQLAQLLAAGAPARRMHALDVFAPETDRTRSDADVEMGDLYQSFLGSGDQRTLFDAVVAGCPNVVTIAGDSASVELPMDRLAFTHIDGNHDPAYVRSDFERTWPLTVPGGVVAFDDYGHDLPDVTAEVDALRAEYAEEIGEFWVAGRKTAMLRKRERAAPA